MMMSFAIVLVIPECGYDIPLPSSPSQICIQLARRERNDKLGKMRNFYLRMIVRARTKHFVAGGSTY